MPIDINDLLAAIGASGTTPTPQPPDSPMLGQTSNLFTLLNALGDPGAGTPPTTMAQQDPMQQAQAQAPQGKQAMELPPLPQSGGVFNTPVLGPILGVARNLIVGPGAEHLATQEQVTRGILNSLILAKNPGALPALRQGYEQADATSLGAFGSPTFRARVGELMKSSIEGGPGLSETAAIARAADEYNVDGGIVRPKTLAELPAVDPNAQLKYLQSHGIVDQVAKEGTQDYAPLGPYTAQQRREAHYNRALGIPATPDEQRIFLLEQRTAAVPGMKFEGADVTEKGVKSKFSAGPTVYHDLPGAPGYEVDSFGNVLNKATKQAVGRVPQTEADTILNAPPSSTVPTEAPQGLSAQPPFASSTSPQQPQAQAAPATTTPRAGDFVIPTHETLPDGTVVSGYQYPDDKTITDTILADMAQGRQLDTAAINEARHAARDAIAKRDLVHSMVGEWNRDKDGNLLDKDGQPMTFPGQIPGGTGLHKFLNKRVFLLDPVNNPDSFFGDLTGALQSGAGELHQRLRLKDTLDPKYYDLQRYDNFVNESVPAYLIAAGVTRTTQTEINLLKRAFPDPKTMTLEQATLMADQLPLIMQARARIAIDRLNTAILNAKDPNHAKPLPEYDDIAIRDHAGNVAFVVSGGSPTINEDDLQPTESFKPGASSESRRGGPTQVQPTEPTVKETEDDIILQGGDN